MSTTTITVGAFDAKTHLSHYLDEVEKGNTVQITRRGKPVAVLVPTDSVYPKEADLNHVLQRVRERRLSYNITTEEVIEWKAEGRG